MKKYMYEIVITFIMFKVIAFLILLFAPLYVRVDNLLTCGKHLHDCIISLREEIWAQKTSLTLPLFTEVPVPSQESELSHICVLGVSIFPLSTIFIHELGIVLTVWHFLFFIWSLWQLSNKFVERKLTSRSYLFI